MAGDHDDIDKLDMLPHVKQEACSLYSFDFCIGDPVYTGIHSRMSLLL